MNARPLLFATLLGAALLAMPRRSTANDFSLDGSLMDPRTASINGSLFDSHTARYVEPGLRSIFGPRSNTIRYDSRMIHAAEIAAERAHRHSTEQCWHSVKNALVAAQVVPTRPITEYAKEAGTELQTRYGFTQIRVSSPYDAPVGAVLVYGGRGAGHVEIRTATGFVSDFISPTPSPRPLLGVYVKRS